ncbi:hypothetical protein GE061_000005 [Apolygus lucorum]|uniref:Uncharacterized protein n=1 Tax=Apolygus lucorum TaxID=248454 RepID=A0A6A4K8H6_APOLU|nr:hypothetical protein GE061_000005 [Apolygus lucorum]
MTGRMDFTYEQLEAVRRIEGSQDYYEILDVSRDASDVDIRRAYKKLALLLHPDKNNAPGAAEAFIVVVTAFEVLSSEEKRREYDLSRKPDMMCMDDLSGTDWIMLGVGAGLGALAGFMLYKASRNQNRSKN